MCYGRREEKEECRLRKFGGIRTETFFSLSVAIIRIKYPGALWALTVRVQVMLQVDTVSSEGEAAVKFNSVMDRENLCDDRNVRTSLYVTIYIEVLVVLFHAFQSSPNSVHGRWWGGSEIQDAAERTFQFGRGITLGGERI